MSHSKRSFSKSRADAAWGCSADLEASGLAGRPGSCEVAGSRHRRVGCEEQRLVLAGLLVWASKDNPRGEAPGQTTG